MKVGKKIKHVKRGISLAKICHKDLKLHTVYKDTKLLEASLDSFLKPKYQR